MQSKLGQGQEEKLQKQQWSEKKLGNPKMACGRSFLKIEGLKMGGARRK